MDFNFDSDKVQVFPNINDKPDTPTSLKAGNGSHLISLHNKLIDDLVGVLAQLDNSITTSSTNSQASLQQAINNLNNQIINIQSNIIPQTTNLIVNQALNNYTGPSEAWQIVTNSGAVYQANPGDKIVVLDFSSPISIIPAPDFPQGKSFYLINVSPTNRQMQTKIYLNTGYKGQNTQFGYLTFSQINYAIGFVHAGSNGGFYPLNDDSQLVLTMGSNTSLPAPTMNTSTPSTSSDPVMTN